MYEEQGGEWDTEDGEKRVHIFDIARVRSTSGKQQETRHEEKPETTEDDFNMHRIARVEIPAPPRRRLSNKLASEPWPSMQTDTGTRESTIPYAGIWHVDDDSSSKPASAGTKRSHDENYVDDDASAADQSTTATPQKQTKAGSSQEQVKFIPKGV